MASRRPAESPHETFSARPAGSCCSGAVQTLREQRMKFVRKTAAQLAQDHPTLNRLKKLLRKRGLLG
ncbi:MAG: hypothetical protein ACK5Q5_22540 [Planctomycetaceae bacterium]